jgi:hypothetical protein
MLPSIIMQYILIKLFPYTGLARVMTVPATIVINSLLIFVCIIITKKYGYRILGITVTLVLSIGITIGIHPQEYNPSVYTQSAKAINAISDFDQITMEDLGVNGYKDKPRYVVALYKFKDQLLLKGTYQLYQEENVYFYNYSINYLEEIASKLIGYHKLMWWYLGIANKGG